MLALGVAVKPDLALTLRLGKHRRGAQFAFPAAGATDPITPTSSIVAKARPCLDAMGAGTLVHVPAQLRRWNRALRAALATAFAGWTSPMAASTVSVAFEGERHSWAITRT